MRARRDYRRQHVGRSKSEVAVERIGLINPSIKVKALTSRMDESRESRSTFSHSFWKETDVVLTALVSRGKGLKRACQEGIIGFIVLFDVEIIRGGVMIGFRSIDIRKLRISI